MFILNVITRFALKLFGAGNRPTQPETTPDPLQGLHTKYNCNGPEQLAKAIKEGRVELPDLYTIRDLHRSGAHIHLDVALVALLKLRDTLDKM